MPVGPIQLLVIGFDEANFTGEVQAELERLRASDVVRIVDLIVVRKNTDGTVERLRHTDLSEADAEEFGAKVGALIGLGMAGEEGAVQGAIAGAEAMSESEGVLDEDVWYVDDVIPPGSAAAIALLEHRWAIPLRESIIRAGGNRLLVDAWIHPTDLVQAGVVMGDELAKG